MHGYVVRENSSRVPNYLRVNPIIIDVAVEYLKPAHSIRSPGCPATSSDHCLSSRNSWPMNSIGIPGAVMTRPIATRDRLRAHQECGFEGSASRGIRSIRL